MEIAPPAKQGGGTFDFVLTRDQATLENMPRPASETSIIVCIIWSATVRGRTEFAPLLPIKIGPMNGR
jgi:hypothetical protein